MYYRRIGELRIDRDIKQIEVAKYLGVEQGTYSGYESGRIKIPAIRRRFPLPYVSMAAENLLV